MVETQSKWWQHVTDFVNHHKSNDKEKNCETWQKSCVTISLSIRTLPMSARYLPVIPNIRVRRKLLVQFYSLYEKLKTKQKKTRLYSPFQTIDDQNFGIILDCGRLRVVSYFGETHKRTCKIHAHARALKDKRSEESAKLSYVNSAPTDQAIWKFSTLILPCYRFSCTDSTRMFHYAYSPRGVGWPLGRRINWSPSTGSWDLSLLPCLYLTAVTMTIGNAMITRGNATIAQSHGFS